MDAREYMEQVVVYDTKIRNKVDAIRALQEAATDTSAAPFDRAGGKTQLLGSKLEALVCKYVETERKLISDMEELYSNISERIETIEKLPTVEYDVLYMTYIQGKDLQEIADKYHRSYRWAQEKRRRALDDLQITLDRQ